MVPRNVAGRPNKTNTALLTESRRDYFLFGAVAAQFWMTTMWAGLDCVVVVVPVVPMLANDKKRPSAATLSRRGTRSENREAGAPICSEEPDGLTETAMRLGISK